MGIDIQAQIQAQIQAAIQRAQAAAAAAAAAAAKAAAQAAAQAAAAKAKVQKPVDAVSKALQKDVFQGAKQVAQKVVDADKQVASAAKLIAAPVKLATEAAKFTEQYADLASKTGALGRANNALKGVAKFASLPGKAMDFFNAAKEVTQQPQNGQAWANLCSQGFNVAASTYKSVEDLEKAVRPGAMATTLTDALHLTGDGGLVEGLKDAGAKALSDGKSILSTISDAGKGAIDAVASKVAGSAGKEAGEKVVEKAALSGGEEAAERFVPGLNVAVAANDTYAAYQTWNDPNASNTRKACAIATAAGDWMAASDVPVVSQVGAVVGTAASVIGAIWG